MSIGLTVFQANHDTVEDALHRADRALYEAKALGRNRVVVAPSTDTADSSDGESSPRRPGHQAT